MWNTFFEEKQYRAVDDAAIEKLFFFLALECSKIRSYTFSSSFDSNEELMIILIIIIFIKKWKIDQMNIVSVGCVLRHLLIIPVILLNGKTFENSTKQKTKKQKNQRVIERKPERKHDTVQRNYQRLT